MTLRLFSLILLFPICVLAQEQEDSGVIINGIVINDADDSELENVEICNVSHK